MDVAQQSRYWNAGVSEVVDRVVPGMRHSPSLDTSVASSADYDRGVVFHSAVQILPRQTKVLIMES